MTDTVLHYRTFERSPEDDWVVFVHGAGGSSSIFYKQLRAFTDVHNVCLVDLRGHGASREVTGGTYSFQALSSDILDVLDELGLEQAHFIGVSLGTILIRSLAETAPERMRSMVLAGAITRLDARSRFLVAMGNLLKRVVPFMWLYRLFAWIIMPRPHHREARELFIQEAANLSRDEFLRWFQLTHDVNPLLQHFEDTEVSIPTLYVMGEQDHLFLPPAREIAARHAFSSLYVVRGSGHVCNVEHPDIFNHVALRFLRKQTDTTCVATGRTHTDLAMLP